MPGSWSMPSGTYIPLDKVLSVATEQRVHPPYPSTYGRFVAERVAERDQHLMLVDIGGSGVVPYAVVPHDPEISAPDAEAWSRCCSGCSLQSPMR